ncbi:hypothetical protein ABKN59_000495 [Abortiporus biennis]
MSELPHTKLSLPAFLKVLTTNHVPASKAMAVAGKIYKTHNTPSALSQLTDYDLTSAGIPNKEDRKMVLAALKKAGYSMSAKPKTNASSSPSSSRIVSNGTGESSQMQHGSAKKKRKRDDDLNELLPERPSDGNEGFGNLEFNEILDEKDLMPKYAVTNRAPIMTAWAFVVAERLGFHREEALSIASVYTEMNAISKGVSIGIYDKGKAKGIEATKGGSQPYVDLMGRRPLFQTASSRWLALSKGTPVAPTAAYSYITRSLRQTTPRILGSLRLLSLSFPPAELNQKGYALYCEFRPDVEGWGKKGEVKCSTILGLRKVQTLKDVKEETSEENNVTVDKMVKFADYDKVESEGAKTSHGNESESEEPPHKKSRGMTVEEYEAMLDADPAFDNIVLPDS